MNDLRTTLAAELAAEPTAPVADLVAGAVRRGRRAVRLRRVVAGTLAVLAVLAGVAGWLGRGHHADRVAGAAATLPAHASSVAYEVLRRLPAGARLTAAFRYENDPAAAAVYVDRGAGAGLVQVTIDTYPPSSQTCRPSAKRSVTCRTGADGSLVAVSRVSGDCTRATVVERFRPDGVHVSVYLATCLMWDGRRYPPAPVALSVTQASALAGDPAWGVRMDARLVSAGAARFGDLPLWVSR